MSRSSGRHCHRVTHPTWLPLAQSAKPHRPTALPLPRAIHRLCLRRLRNAYSHSGLTAPESSAAFLCLRPTRARTKRRRGRQGRTGWRRRHGRQGRQGRRQRHGLWQPTCGRLDHVDSGFDLPGDGRGDRLFGFVRKRLAHGADDSGGRGAVCGCTDVGKMQLFSAWCWELHERWRQSCGGELIRRLKCPDKPDDCRSELARAQPERDLSRVSSLLKSPPYEGPKASPRSTNVDLTRFSLRS